MKRNFILLALVALFGTILNAQTARVQIIHNSPDAAASAVDVWLDNTLLLDSVQFREATPFLNAPAGTAFDIRVKPANSTDTINPLFRQTFNLPANDTFIIVANGIISATGYSPATPFALDVFPVARETAAGGMMTTDVLVYHGSTDAPTVDVYESSVPAGTIVDDISYADFQGYLSLATADYTLEVRNENNSAIVAAYQAPLNTLNLGGEALTVLASGFLDPTANSNGPAFGLYVALASGGPLVALPAATIPTARIQAIHNSADLAAEYVDVYLNDGLLLNNFQFRNASPFVDVQAGVPFEISIADSSSSDTTTALAKFTYTLQADSTYILVANGIVSPSGYSPSTAFNIDVYASARENATGGMMTTDVLVYHGSTDAPTVDVYESSVPAGTIVDDISYADFQGYLSLATADYTLEVRNENNSAIVAAYQAPLNTLNLGGEALTVLASGFLDPTANSNGPAFGLYVALASGGPLVALPAATIPTARVQAIHNSADLAAEYVDVYLNDGLLLDNFQFRTASPFVDVQAGVPFEISIADSSSSDTSTAIANFTYTLQADSTYILIANGIVSPTGYSPATPFNLDVFASARETAAGGMMTTDVLVYHGVTDAPAVDITETSVPAGLIVDSITYSNYDGYLGLATADYVLDLSATGTTLALGTFSAPLNTLNLGGAAITVLASGFANVANNSNGPSFGLWVALASGGALVPLSNITSLSEIDARLNNAINLYPNPSNGNIQLSIDNSNVLPKQIEVVDLNGRVVREISVSNQSSQNINLEDLSRGTYLMRFFGDEGIAIKKIIIQ